MSIPYLTSYLWIFNPLLERNHTSVCRTVLNMYSDEIPPPYEYPISKVNIIYSFRCPHTYAQFLIKSINDLFNKSYTYMVKGKKKCMLRHDVPQLKGGKNYKL